MAIEKRDELIMDLYKNVIGEEPYKMEQDDKRFHADTNTLMNKGKIDIRSARRHEIPLEEKDYSEIIMGSRQFSVVKDNGILLGDVVVFIELSGFQQTGNTTLRNISFVDNTSAGIEEGYCVIGWK